MSTALLELRQITVSFDGFLALRDLNLSLQPGELRAVIGPNGAGKSTAMKSVFGLLTIRSGRMLFDGDDITGWAPNRIVQRGICYVPQVDNIFREMSIHENLEMGGFLKKGDLSAAYDRVYTLFPDLKERRKTLAGALSGGQRQRICIARALVMKPRVILFDEPTSALDMTVQKSLIQLLESLQERLGLGYLFISHDIALIGSISDEIIVINDGVVVERGTACEIINEPRHPYTIDLIKAAERKSA